MGHYLAAQWWEPAAALIEQVGEQMLALGSQETLQGWIEALPSENRRRPYRLTASGAGVLREQLSGMERLVQAGLRRLVAG